MYVSTNHCFAFFSEIFNFFLEFYRKKKIRKKNYFLMFGFTMKNIKYNQNSLKFYIFLKFLVLI